MATAADDATTAAASGLPARRAVLSVLETVLNRRQPLDIAIAQAVGWENLPSQDRAFSRLLLLTILRRLPEIDRLYTQFLDRPLPHNPRRLTHLLRLGTAQLVFLKTPPHAAVDTAVALAGELRNRKFKGLVNALLRKVGGTGGPLEDDAAARLNTPDWLWQSWCGAYGEPAADGIARSHLQEPPLDLTVKQEPELWANRLEAEILPNGSLRRTGGGDPSGWPGFAEGVWWVQDAAAALPVALLGDIKGLTAIDLCAAPGGKTAQLAAGGAEVTALDISEKRLRRLESNMKRLGLDVATAAADLREWRPPTKADLVVLDAPCTATGTCRRHPDILRLRAPADVAKMDGVQRSLLDAAQEMVAENGTLLYITCSLQPEEGPAQIAHFLERFPRFERQPFAHPDWPGLKGAVTADGALRTLPSHWSDRGGMDGFFAVALRRVS